jgi:hypothetical protein
MSGPFLSLAPAISINLQLIGTTGQPLFTPPTVQQMNVALAPVIKGAPGGGLQAPLNFAYGDASPDVVFTPAVDCELTDLALQITTPFDGVGASLKVGTIADPALLMDTWQNDPGSACIYETSPHQALSAGTAVRLTINPGTGASQGAGQLIFTVLPTT